jgi:hypothetical protein
LGKRKKKKNSAPIPARVARVRFPRARAAAARTARIIQAQRRKDAPVTVADGIPVSVAAAADLPAAAPSSSPGASSAWDAAFSAGVDADNAAGASMPAPASAADPAAVDDAPVDVFGGDAGGDVVFGGDGVDGLGKSFFSKIGKAVSKIAPVALPVGAALIGGPLAAAAAGAVGNPRANVAAANAPVTVKDQFGNLLSRIGDVLLDSAGRGVAQLVGGQWVSNPSLNPPTFNGGSSGSAPASSGQNLTPWLIGGAALVAVVILSRK